MVPFSLGEVVCTRKLKEVMNPCLSKALWINRPVSFKLDVVISIRLLLIKQVVYLLGAVEDHLTIKDNADMVISKILNPQNK